MLLIVLKPLFVFSLSINSITIIMFFLNLLVLIFFCKGHLDRGHASDTAKWQWIVSVQPSSTIFLTIPFSHNDCWHQGFCLHLALSSGSSFHRNSSSCNFSLPISYSLNKKSICVSCQLGKSKQLSFSDSSRESIAPLEILHCDVGPLPLIFWVIVVIMLLLLMVFLIFVECFLFQINSMFILHLLNWSL
jgi:hypothetical protein